MKKIIEKIQRQAKDESMKAGLVVLGAVGGIVTNKLLNKITADQPMMNAIVKYGYPALLTGGGFILSCSLDGNHKLKYLGYGLTAAGIWEGVNVIPFVKEQLSGILGDIEIPAANAFLTESEERQKIMDGFGMTTLPVGKATLQSPNDFEPNLPDLQGSGIGYNGSTTDDVDPVSGIL
jgi:hypothetical protein